MKANTYDPLESAFAGTFNGMTGLDYEAGFKHQLSIWIVDKPVKDLLYENFSKFEEAAKASEK